MKTYDLTWLKTSVAADRHRVALTGIFDGYPESTGRYLDRCTAFHEPTGTMMLFSRDVGHHTSGWWKNPDYERCWHLSLSFLDPTSKQPAPRDRAMTREWLALFFGKDRNKLWSEPPYSIAGKGREVWHYRLFCTPVWTPILPRGEVYTRELTEAGWKSWSDVQAGLREDEEMAQEMRADSSKHQTTEETNARRRIHTP